MEQEPTGPNTETPPAGDSPAGGGPRRVRQVNRHGATMQPMAGERQKLIGAQFETVAFANRRKKSRARRALQKASRAKNRGK